MMYKSHNETYEQRCSIIELEESTIDCDSRDILGSKQLSVNAKEINRNQFIVNRIQCLQDQKREQLASQNFSYQEALYTPNGYNENQSQNFQLFDNTWNGKAMRDQQSNDDKENSQYYNNSNAYYYDGSVSQQMRCSEGMSQNAVVEKRISMKPELFYAAKMNMNENKVEEMNHIRQQMDQQEIREVKEEQYYDRDASQYGYNQQSLNHNEDQQSLDEEQYDYINEQEYERMMSEIEERETKGKVHSNAFENYQLFKPSFHEEILKKNNQGKTIHSFSKKNEMMNDQENVNQQEEELTPIDSVIFYPHNFSTFNQNGGVNISNGGCSAIDNTDLFQNKIRNNDVDQKSISQCQLSSQLNERENINIQNKKQNGSNALLNQQYLSNKSDSQQDIQNNDNTFQTTLFQNSFQQQQQQQSHMSPYEKSNMDAPFQQKNMDMPLQKMQFYDMNTKLTQPRKDNDKHQRSFENEKYTPSNLLAMIDQSNKKESSRYPNNTSNISNIEVETTDAIRNRQHSAHQPSSYYAETKQSESQNGYKPTKFTQFFLGNTSNQTNSHLTSTENTTSVYKQEQLISSNRSKEQSNNNKSRQPAQSLHQPSSIYSYELSYFKDSSQEQLVSQYLANHPPTLPLYSDNPIHDNSISKMTTKQQQQTIFGECPSLRGYIEGDIQNSKMLIGYDNRDIADSNRDRNENNTMSYQNYNQNDSQQKINEVCQTVAAGSKANVSYFNDIPERSQTFYNDRSQITTYRNICANDDESLNDRALSARPLNNSNNVTHQLNSTSHILNDFSQNFLDHSFTDRPRFNTQYTQQIQGQSNVLSKRQQEDVQNQSFNKEPLHFNLNIGGYQNDNQQNKQLDSQSYNTDRLLYNRDTYLQYTERLQQNTERLQQNTDRQLQQNKQNRDKMNYDSDRMQYDSDRMQQNSDRLPNQPQFIQKQFQNIEKKLQMINQTKQTSFHQNQPAAKGIAIEQQQQQHQSNKQSDMKQQNNSSSSSFLPKPYQPIEERLLQKSKEREIQKQEKSKQQYIQVNETMKKHKISTKSNALASNLEQNHTVYERNQRFMREKEQKQLQLKEEQIKSEIQHPFSPHIRPQSQNMVRNVNDLVAWKENINQKNVENRNKQIVDEIKELESLQNEKLICKGSERILQNSSRIHNKQKVEDHLIVSGMKYQQHKEELEKHYNTNPTKNIPMINKNTFKLLLNSKKKPKESEMHKQQQQQLSYNSNPSPRNLNSQKNDSVYSKRQAGKEHASTSSTSTPNYNLSNANSNQPQNFKEPHQAFTQNLAKVYSNNFSSQQTLSTQPSQSQSNLLSNQNLRYLYKQQEEEQDQFSDNSVDKVKQLSQQKHQAGVDQGNGNQVKNITESKLKIKNILQQQQQQQHNIQSGTYLQQINQGILTNNQAMAINQINQAIGSNNNFNNNNNYNNTTSNRTYDNLLIQDYNSPKMGNQDGSSNSRYYTNESLKKSFELRQNYMQQKQSRENSKQSRSNNSANSHTNTSTINNKSHTLLNNKCYTPLNNKTNVKSDIPKIGNQMSVQERNKHWQEQKIIKQNLFLQQLRNEEAQLCPFKPQLQTPGQKSGSASRSITPTKNIASHCSKDLVVKTKQSYAKQFNFKAQKNQ